jgi:hypothetical protein
MNAQMQVLSSKLTMTCSLTSRSFYLSLRKNMETKERSMGNFLLSLFMYCSSFISICIFYVLLVKNVTKNQIFKPKHCRRFPTRRLRALFHNEQCIKSTYGKKITKKNVIYSIFSTLNRRLAKKWKVKH